MTETRPAKSRGGVRGSGDEVRQQRGRGQCQTGQDTWGRAPVLPLAPRRGCYRAVGRPSRVQGSRVALALGRSSTEPVPSPAERTSLEEEAERLTGLRCRAAGRVTAQGVVLAGTLCRSALGEPSRLPESGVAPRLLPAHASTVRKARRALEKDPL